MNIRIKDLLGGQRVDIGDQGDRGYGVSSCMGMEYSVNNM